MFCQACSHAPWNCALASAAHHTHLPVIDVRTVTIEFLVGIMSHASLATSVVLNSSHCHI